MIEQTYSDRKKLIISIVLALLFYSLLLMLIFYTQYEKDPWNFLSLDQEVPITFETLPESESEVEQSIVAPIKEEKPSIPEQAALHSRPSVFGATQEEQEIPEFMPGTTDSFSSQSVADSTSESVQADDDTKDNEVQKKVAEKIEPKNETLAEKSEIVSDNLSTERPKSPDMIAELPRATLAEQKETAPDKRPIQSVAVQTQKKSIKKNGPTRDNSGGDSKIASPIKKQITFADLAQGLIEQKGNDGQDWIDRKGNENIRPDLEDLKNMSYHLKLQWHVQNLLRMKPAPPRKEWTDGLQTACAISIDENGFIQSIQLARSSGNTDYDEWVLNFFKSITPYPMPPKRVLTPYFNVQWTITLSQQLRIQYAY